MLVTHILSSREMLLKAVAVCSPFFNKYVAFEKPVEPLQTSPCRELVEAHGSRPDVSDFDIVLSKSIPSYLQVLLVLFCFG